MDEIELREDMLVVHKNKPEWGPGRIVRMAADCQGSRKTSH